MAITCRVCGNPSCPEILDFGRQPNSLRLLASAGERTETYPLALAHCPACDFIFIAEPLPPEAFYGDLQAATSQFPALHLPALADRAMALAGGEAGSYIYEIGCNDGLFLSLLREKGATDLLGLEPSEPCVALARARGLPVDCGFFTRERAQALLGAAGSPSLVVCRHVLEHVIDLDDFTAGLELLVQQDGVLILEMPDLGAIERLGDLSAIWEQHVNYFDLAVLRRLLARRGLHLLEASALPHGGGSLLAVFSRRAPAGPEPPLTGRAFLVRQLESTRAKLHDSLAGWRKAGLRTLAFGAGMRGTMLINLAGIAPFLEGVIDDTPGKVGWHLPGSGLPILHPGSLAQDPPRRLLLLPLSSKQSERKVARRLAPILGPKGRIAEYLPGDGSVLNLMDGTQD